MPDSWLKTLRPMPGSVGWTGMPLIRSRLPRQCAQLLVLEARDLDAEQVAKLQQHLVHRRVAGALADAVHAGGEHLRARAQRHHGVPRAEAEVVVKVHDQGRVGRRGLDRRDVLAHGEGRVAAHGVWRRGSGAAGLEAFAVDLGDVVDVGAAAVFAAELDRRRALLARVADRLAHHPQVGLAVVGHRQLQPLRLGNAVAVQQRLAQLVLDVQVGRRREDEVRHLVALVTELVDARASWRRCRPWSSASCRRPRGPSRSSPRLRPSRTRRSVSRSLSETDGKPTSMMCTPMSESIRASSYLSFGVIATPGICSPSRSVSS